MLAPIEILFLAADPRDTARLQLGDEIRAIEQKIQMSARPDRISMMSKWAVRADDLIQALNQHKPHIVQFSGHGSAAEEILLLDESGRAKAVSKAALVKLFKVLKGNIRVVVLNACFSRRQAEAITEVVDFAIGMSKAISDAGATIFSASFYRAIAWGASIQEAFDQGCAALALEGMPDNDVPQLIAKEGSDPGTTILNP